MVQVRGGGLGGGGDLHGQLIATKRNEMFPTPQTAGQQQRTLSQIIVSLQPFSITSVLRAFFFATTFQFKPPSSSGKRFRFEVQTRQY